MAEKIPMLALSPTMEEGAIVKWVKQEGDSVSMSEVLCEVETDKATMEFESPAEGTLLKIVVPEGKSAAVGATIAILGEEGEDISGMTEEAPKEKGEKKKEKPAEAEAKGEEPEPEEEPEEATGEEKQPEPDAEPKKKEKPAGKAKEEKPEGKKGEVKIRSTPLARKLAEERGIELASIQGTGPDGRITREDVEKAGAGGKPSAKPAATRTAVSAAKLTDETVPLSGMRKAIAQRLSESKFSAPHYYLQTSVVMDSLLRARQKINQRTNNKVTLNAFLMKFVAMTLARHPMVNASWGGDAIIKHGSVDVALAVAIEEGLITPVVRGCHEKGVLVIDAELKTLIEKARAGRLQKEEYADSTFTITNLGSFGIEEFTAIINPPNSAILAVGRAVKTPVADEQDHINVHQVLKMTLSCDHRVIDGAVGAAFLQDLKEMMEYPTEGLL